MKIWPFNKPEQRQYEPTAEYRAGYTDAVSQNLINIAAGTDSDAQAESTAAVEFVAKPS